MHCVLGSIPCIKEKKKKEKENIGPFEESSDLRFERRLGEYH
jgi:hypothetical protein